MGIPKKLEVASATPVAIVILSLLVFGALYVFVSLMPSNPLNAREAHSDAYWRGEAGPFAILEHALNSTENTFIFLVMNKGEKQLEIKNISIAGSGHDAVHMPAFNESSFTPGQKRLLQIHFSNGSCSPGNYYELYLNITYSDGNETKMQYGVKQLWGKCS